VNAPRLVVVVVVVVIAAGVLGVLTVIGFSKY